MIDWEALRDRLMERAKLELERANAWRAEGKDMSAENCMGAHYAYVRAALDLQEAANPKLCDKRERERLS